MLGGISGKGTSLGLEGSELHGTAEERRQSQELRATNSPQGLETQPLSHPMMVNGSAGVGTETAQS